MTFIAKALLGVATVVIPSSIGVTVAYKDSLFGSSSTNNKVDISVPDLSDLKSRCYVIPTEESNNKKLLICKDKNSEDTGSGKYEYWYRGEGGKRSTKVTTISKKGENLEITLNRKDPPSTITLRTNDDKWNKIQDKEDLESDCPFSETGEEGKLQCIGDDSLEITLSKFQG